MNRLTLIACAAGLAWAGAAHAEGAGDQAMCATAAQKEMVTDFYAERAGAPPPIAERLLHMPEEVVVSALPPENAVGASAEHFDAVWRSASEWDGWVTHIVTKHGNLFKFPGPVSAHRENTRGDAFYDVKPAERGDGLDAHFRPDLMTTIYAVDLPGRGGASRAVVFYDRTGESVLGLYATIAGEPEAEGRVEQFEKTWDLIAALPDACPGLD